MAIADYNTDPDLNVDISGINIAEGCPPSGINNAIRQMMADVKSFTDAPTFSGGMTVSSGATISGGIVMQAGDGNELTTTADNVTLTIAGGTDATDAPFLALVGKTKDANGGRFVLHADNGANESNLAGFPDGTLTWGNKDFVYTSTDQTIGGTKTFSSDIIITSTEGRLRKQSSGPASGNIGFDWYNTTSSIDMIYVQGWWNNDNAGLTLASRNTSDSNKYYAVSLRSHSSATHYFEPTVAGIYLGRNSSGYKWKQVIAESSTISTSDEREKSNISAIPDSVLDAWGDVSWSQFQMNEAIAEKGEEKARQHTGLVAQRIDAVFRSHNLDISRYGLFCWDSWAAEPEERDENGNVISPAQEASDAYALRYEEALAMEAAYQRRRASRAEARITALEQRLGELEQAIAALAGGAE